MRLRTEIKEASRKSNEISKRIKQAQVNITNYISQLDPTKARVLEIGTQLYNSTRDRSELKAYTNPTDEVKNVIAAVMVAFDERTDWRNAKTVSTKQKFLVDVQRFSEKEYLKLDSKKVKILGKYCQEDYFQPELIRKDSIAAAKLCEWIRTIVKYHILHEQIQSTEEIMKEGSQQMMMI